jgi:hypothetical protein
MSLESNSSVLYDAAGVAVAGADGSTAPTSALLVAGQDGTNLQSLLVDSSGSPVIVGSGTAGTPAGGVLTVQGDAAGTPIPISGTVTTSAPTSATGTVTSVAASLTNVTLKASNASRKGLTVYNDGTARLFLKCGATASATSFTTLVPAGGYWEAPFGYTGIVDGLWNVANGSARITEFT